LTPTHGPGDELLRWPDGWGRHYEGTDADSDARASKNEGRTKPGPTSILRKQELSPDGFR
jgi:hypothetical protein